MVSDQFDATLARWLGRQLTNAASHYHVQVKLLPDEVEMAQLTAADLQGWVIIDWQQRGVGLSARRALDPASHPPGVAQALDTLAAETLHAQIQLVLAPAEDWEASYRHDSLAPDLLPVLDAGRTAVLNVSAERNSGDWRILQAHQPPDDQPILDFGF
jgi:hypothetical protein